MKRKKFAASYVLSYTVSTTERHLFPTQIKSGTSFAEVPDVNIFYSNAITCGGGACHAKVALATTAASSQAGESQEAQRSSGGLGNDKHGSCTHSGGNSCVGYIVNITSGGEDAYAGKEPLEGFRRTAAISRENAYLVQR